MSSQSRARNVRQYCRACGGYHSTTYCKLIANGIPEDSLLPGLIHQMSAAVVQEHKQTLARMTSLAAPEATLWLTSKPTTPAFSFPDPVFCVLVRSHLGLPVGDDIVARCKCNEPITA